MLVWSDDRWATPARRVAATASIVGGAAQHRHRPSPESRVGRGAPSRQRLRLAAAAGRRLRDRLRDHIGPDRAVRLHEARAAGAVADEVWGSRLPAVLVVERVFV